MIRHPLRIDRLEDRLTPAIATWDGGGANANWMTAANWVGDVAPMPGDELIFPDGPTQRTTNNDFLAGTSFARIEIDGLRYQIGGNPVVLATEIASQIPVSIDPNDTSHIDLPITLGGDLTVTGFANVPHLVINSAIDLNGHNLTVSADAFNVEFRGVISGHGGVRIAGGSPQFDAVNTFDGGTTVDAQSGGIIVNGQVGTVSLVVGGLSGTGFTGPIAMTGGYITSSFTTPGLTLGNFNQTGGELMYDIPPLGTLALTVHGSVHVGGKITVGVSTTAQLTLGNKFTLLNNDGVDQVTGTFVGAPEGAFVGGNQALALQISYHGGDGNDIAVTVVRRPTSAVGAGQTGLPLVNIYDATGVLMRSFLAYQSNFTGGVRVAVADVTGDGVNDVVTAPGPGGGPVVRIWDGSTGAMVRQFNAYDPAFRGGMSLAAADLTGDGVADIVTGAGAGGGPHVKLFDGATGAVLSSFMAYDQQFRGGVNVAAHERSEVFIFGQGTQTVPGSIVTGPGAGGGPHVRVFDALTAHVTNEFLAYSPVFTGGVNVATGTLGVVGPDRFGSFEIETAPASQGGPVVRLFATDGRMFNEFLAYDAAFFGGVTISTIRISTNFAPILLTGAGPGGGSLVKQWRTEYETYPPHPVLERSTFAFDPAFIGGIYVG